MKTRRLLLAISCIVALGVIAWLASGSCDVGDSHVASDSAEDAREGGPLLAGRASQDAAPVTDDPQSAEGSDVSEERCVVHGTVRLASGPPLANAHVLLFRLPTRRPAPVVFTRRTTTNAEGAYEIAGIPAGDYGLVAQHADAWYPPSRLVGDAARHGRTPTLPKEVEVSIAVGDARRRADRVLVPGVTVRGRVLDHEDRPLAGAEIFSQGGASNRDALDFWSGSVAIEVSPEPIGRSDAEGRFELRAVVPNLRMRLFATHGEGIPVPSPRQTFATGDELVLRVVAGAHIEGTVLDAAGQPASGVLVKRYGGNNPLSQWDDVTTGADGTFRFRGAPPGTSRLRVVRATRVYPVSHVEGLAPGEVRTGLELRPFQTVRLSGTVHTSEGAPVEGLELSLAPVQRGVVLGDPPLTITDAAGQFTFEDALCIPCVIRVHDPLGMGVRPILARLTPDDVPRRLVYDRPRSFTLEIRVTDADGRPIPNCRFLPGTTRFRGAIPTTLPVTTIEAGQGEVRLPWKFPMPFVVGQARSADGSLLDLADVSGTLEEGSSRLLEIQLPPAVRLRGRVVNQRREGLADVLVRLDSNASALTDTEGHFHFERLAKAQRYFLYASPPHGYVRPDPLQVQAGRSPVEIILAEGEEISGRIMWSEGRMGLRASVRARWRRKDGSVQRTSRAIVEPDGAFVLHGVPRGLLVEIEGDVRHEQRQIGVVKQAGVRAGTRNLELQVQVQTSGRIEGVVVDHAGQPQRGATVKIQSPDGRPQRFVSCAAGGTWFQGGLEDDRYVVFVIDAKGRPASPKVDVQPGDPPVELKLFDPENR